MLPDFILIFLISILRFVCQAQNSKFILLSKSAIMNILFLMSINSKRNTPDCTNCAKFECKIKSNLLCVHNFAFHIFHNGLQYTYMRWSIWKFVCRKGFLYKDLITKLLVIKIFYIYTNLLKLH